MTLFVWNLYPNQDLNTNKKCLTSQQVFRPLSFVKMGFHILTQPILILLYQNLEIAWKPANVAGHALKTAMMSNSEVAETNQFHFSFHSIYCDIILTLHWIWKNDTFDWTWKWNLRQNQFTLVNDIRNEKKKHKQSYRRMWRRFDFTLIG